eukprot:scaffold10561_cov67-Skeletonema_dohrnii-CCMP3373.AAC.1
MDGGVVVVLLLEVMAADWNAHVPDVAVAVIAAKSAVEVIAKKSADGTLGLEKRFRRGVELEEISSTSECQLWESISSGMARHVCT